MADILKTLSENHIQFVDFRFTDMRGALKHITLHASQIDAQTLTEGIGFDGSSLDGWCPIEKSDMRLMPDAKSAFIDPFTAHPTLNIHCDVYHSDTNTAYNRCPRGIAKRAEAYLQQSGFADSAVFGPELEFFLFDKVHYDTRPESTSVRIESDRGYWQAPQDANVQASGHVAAIKDAYFATYPVDTLQNVRSEIVLKLIKCGIEATLHHPEVASGGQCEVGMASGTPLEKADHVQTFKNVVHQVASLYGLTATFMPRPLGNDNGSGMHVHQSLWQGNTPLFAGDDYAGLSEMALYYIGGIMKHAKALAALTNPTTNSYKRLIPGFEAPVMMAYAARNRSAAIRIPATHGSKAKRIETRFPDPSANPYLAFAALLMAGIDGVKHKIHPDKACEENLYALSEAQAKRISQLPSCLAESLAALEKDHAFLLEGGVFDKDMLQAFIALKQEEVQLLNRTPHPMEFALYFNC